MGIWPITFISLSIIVTIAIKYFEKKPKFIESNLLLNENKFWEVINETLKKSNGDYELQQEILEKELKKLSLQEIIEFDNRFKELRGKANNWELWGAIYIINGGCGDDSFHYFREWIISQGKEFYYKTIENPKTLIDLKVDVTEIEWEGISYVASTLFEKITNKEIPSEFIENYEVNGNEWEEEELQNIFPELIKKYPNNI